MHINTVTVTINGATGSGTGQMLNAIKDDLTNKGKTWEGKEITNDAFNLVYEFKILEHAKLNK